MYRALITVCLVLGLVRAGGSLDQPPLPTRPGYYHGASGWYMPDNSGKYRHDPRPYDGGYGDRGRPYSNDLRGIFRQAEEQLRASVQEAEENFALGPRDHLRFMIDFNYNGTGWQIIQFEWVRDGDEQRHFNYVNENKLWDTEAESQSQPAHAYQYEQPQPALPSPSYEQQQSQTEYEETKSHTENNPVEVQSTISEVLEYIQQQILPNLN